VRTLEDAQVGSCRAGGGGSTSTFNLGMLQSRFCSQADGSRGFRALLAQARARGNLSRIYFGGTRRGCGAGRGERRQDPESDVETGGRLRESD